MASLTELITLTASAMSLLCLTLLVIAAVRLAAGDRPAEAYLAVFLSEVDNLH